MKEEPAVMFFFVLTSCCYTTTQEEGLLSFVGRNSSPVFACNNTTIVRPQIINCHHAGHAEPQYINASGNVLTRLCSSMKYNNIMYFQTMRL